MGFYRYRNYVVFAATSLFMVLGCAMLLDGDPRAGPGRGSVARVPARMARPYYLATLDRGRLLFTSYFVFRFAWVGRKIARGADRADSAGRRCRCS